MAVKASVTITISCYRDTDTITRFYKLQTSMDAVPAKPTTLNPSGWTDTEPTYVSGSTNTLYFTDRYIFSNGTFQYTLVSKSTSYEAAKEAYNKASAAQDIANLAQENINNYISKQDIIVGTQTNTTRFWTGVSQLDTLEDGDQILYWLPYSNAYDNAGDRIVGVNMRENSTTIRTKGTRIDSFESGTSSQRIWLNLILKDGTETGWIPCYYSSTTRLTSHYSGGNAIRLTYRVNANVSGVQYTGWFVDANYDSGNTYDRLRFQSNVKAKNTIQQNRLIVGDSNGYFHLVGDITFDIDKPILFAGSNITAGSVNTNTYLMYSYVDLRNNVSGISLEDKQTVYIKGILNNNKFTTVADNPFTTTKPTEDDGKYYISLGVMYSTTNCGLFPEHPIFKFSNGSFKNISQIAFEAQDDINNLDIGGRNYILDSAKEQIINLIQSSGGTVFYNNQRLEISSILKTLDSSYKTFIFSCDAYYEYNGDDLEDHNVKIQLYFRNDGSTNVFTLVDTQKITRSWSRVYCKAVFKTGTTIQDADFVYFRATGNANGIKVHGKNFKVEKGNRDTDWVQAPEDEKKEISEYANSRGEQLVINGTGILNDNTNFSTFEFDGSNAYNCPGSFKRKTKGYPVSTDEYFIVNPDKSYKVTSYMKTTLGTMKFYDMLLFYDSDKNEIAARNHMYISGSTTELAEDLKNGDTTVKLVSAAGFNNTYDQTYRNGLIFWNYKNSFGYEYPSQTYSRNVYQNLYTKDNIDKTNNIITLKQAWNKGTIPAGTKVSQCDDGSTYKYIHSNTLIPNEWTEFTGIVRGIDYSGRNSLKRFPPGTAYARVGWLWNYNNVDDYAWICNVSVTENLSAKDAVVNVDVEYYLSTSETSCTGGSWSTIAPQWEAGKYMWSRQKVTYGDDTVLTRNETCISGAKGDTGGKGTGIVSITEEYYLSTSKTSQNGGSWTTLPPPWEPNKYIWTRSKIVYKDPSSTIYTEPICSSEWEAVNELKIGGKNLFRAINDHNYSFGEKTSLISTEYDNNVGTFKFKGEASSNISVLGNYIANIKDVKELTVNGHNINLSDETASLRPILIFYDENNSIITGSGMIGIDNQWIWNDNYNGYYTESLLPQVIPVPTNAVGVKFALATDLEDSMHECWLCITIGNKATNWTLAPEDIDDNITTQTNNINNNIGNIQNDLQTQVTGITENVDDINSRLQDIRSDLDEQVKYASSEIDSINAIIKNLVTDKDGHTLMTQTGSGWTFNMTNIQDTLDSLAEELATKGDDNSALVDNLQGLINELTTQVAYVECTSVNNVPTIILGASNSNFKVKITNTEISFMNGGNKPAYINGNIFYGKNVTIEQQLKIGKTSGYIWQKRSNGNLGLVYTSS